MELFDCYSLVNLLKHRLLIVSCRTAFYNIAAMFLAPNHPLLSKKIHPVAKNEFQTAKLQHEIEQMIEVAVGQQKDRLKPVMVGLAAPQIGINKRIILADIAADGRGNVGNLQVFINPEISWQSKEEKEWYEGCYSTGNICGIVSRAKRIKLKAYTCHSGKQRLLQNPDPGRARMTSSKWFLTQESFSVYTARIIQHEIDHLDGIRFPDRISDETKLHLVEKHEFPVYRDKQAWRTWKKRASKNQWKQLKKSEDIFQSNQ